MQTVRSIAAECASGDGSLLEVTTFDQTPGDDVVLTFAITDSEDLRSSVRVTAAQIVEIREFMRREWIAFEPVPVDEDAMCGHSLDGEDCALVDDHPSIPGTLPGPGERGHITTAGDTWTAED